MSESLHRIKKPYNFWLKFTVDRVYRTSRKRYKLLSDPSEHITLNHKPSQALSIWMMQMWFLIKRCNNGAQTLQTVGWVSQGMTIMAACQHQTFVNNVCKMVQANRCLSLKQLVLAFSLSHSTVWDTAHKCLGCCKLCSKWVPKYYASVWQRILTEWPCHWPTCHFPKLKVMTHIVLHIVTRKDTRTHD